MKHLTAHMHSYHNIPTRMRKQQSMCADYNAFGYDPNGLIAHLTAHFYGPRWKPHYNVQQYVGQIQPPRYGPPAPYQIQSLPPNFRPWTLPNYYGKPVSLYLDPPALFDPNVFAALRLSARWQKRMDMVNCVVTPFLISLTMWKSTKEYGNHGYTTDAWREQRRYDVNAAVLFQCNRHHFLRDRSDISLWDTEQYIA